MRNLDRFQGCLVAGATRNALGYAVEFENIHNIRHDYGSQGITDYDLYKGKARISDDTQMPPSRPPACSSTKPGALQTAGSRQNLSERSGG